jgi:hypothetical protein
MIFWSGILRAAHCFVLVVDEMDPLCHCALPEQQLPLEMAKLRSKLHSLTYQKYAGMNSTWRAVERSMHLLYTPRRGHCPLVRSNRAQPRLAGVRTAAFETTHLTQPTRTIRFSAPSAAKWYPRRGSLVSSRHPPIDLICRLQRTSSAFLVLERIGLIVTPQYSASWGNELHNALSSTRRIMVTMEARSMGYQSAMLEV